MSQPVDIEAIRARLSEYDPSAPRCSKKVAEHRNYAPDYMRDDDPEWSDFTVTTYHPCCRPAGHEGECRNSRRVMGWPGRSTLLALIDEVEHLRAEVAARGATLAALGLHENTPHEQVLAHVRALVKEHAEMRMVIEGHRHRFNKENP